MTTKAETHEDIVMPWKIENFEQVIKCEKAETSELEKCPNIEIKLTR